MKMIRATHQRGLHVDGYVHLHFNTFAVEGKVQSLLTWGNFGIGLEASEASVGDREIRAVQQEQYLQLRTQFWRYIGAK